MMTVKYQAHFDDGRIEEHEAEVETRAEALKLCVEGPGAHDFIYKQGASAVTFQLFQDGVKVPEPLGGGMTATVQGERDYLAKYGKVNGHLTAQSQP